MTPAAGSGKEGGAEETMYRRLTGFARENGLYVVLLAFMIIFNLLVAAARTPEESGEARRQSQALLEQREAFDAAGDLMMSQSELEKVLRKNPAVSVVLGLTNLILLFVFLAGLILDGTLIAFMARGGHLDIATYRPPPAAWSLADVAKVVILFMSCGYAMLIAEVFAMNAFPAFKNGNIRMVVNSSVLDVLAVAFVLWFVVRKHRARLVSLGLTLRHFFRNVAYGIAGYVAAVPVFIAVLVVVFVAVKLTGYTPEKQPVVELFLKEEDPTFLLYTSIFASILGPFVEEIFFRGFFYNAAKKVTGAAWAMVLTSCVFSMLHTNLVGFLPIMVLGLVLAYLYEKTGSLIPSITVHIIHNLTMVFFVFLAKGVRSL